MDEHGATSFPFVVREIISTAVSQTELDEVIATYGVTLSCLSGPDGQDQYWCAQLAEPVKRRIKDSDYPRHDPDYVGFDDEGGFAWTHYVALRPHDGAFGPGAQGAMVDFAYVVDASVGADTVFDSTKVDWVAAVVVDVGGPDYTASPQPQLAADEAATPPPLADPCAPPVSPLPPGRALLDEPTAVATSEQQFARALDNVIATLASLTGTPVNEVPRPTQVKARKHSRYHGAGPSYSFDGAELRYHTADPVHGLMWRSTTDPDEALCWMADDVARSLALSWAQRTRSARTLDDGQVRWLLAIPMWQTLITALDVRWAGRTHQRISELRRDSEQRTTRTAH